MSERIYSGYSGPLDRVRAIEDEALLVDQVVAEQGVGPEEQDEYLERIQQLTLNHPYLYKEVIIYGEPLTISMDSNQYEPTFHLLTLPGDGGRGHLDRTSQTKGIYRGYAIKYVYDSLNDTYAQRLVHAVHVAQTRIEEIDEYHDAVTTIRSHMNYFTFMESVVIPALPLNMHSLEDLAKDGSMIHIDEVAFAGTDTFETIQNIGLLANKILERNEWDELAGERSMQRVSYINSLGLLEGVDVLSEDMVVTSIDRPFHPLETVYCKSDEGVIRFQGGIFDVGPRYNNLSTGEFLSGGAPELYVKVETSTEQAMYTPVRSIIGTIDT